MKWFNWQSDGAQRHAVGPFWRVQMVATRMSYPLADGRTGWAPGRRTSVATHESEAVHESLSLGLQAMRELGLQGLHRHGGERCRGWSEVGVAASSRLLAPTPRLSRSSKPHPRKRLTPNKNYVARPSFSESRHSNTPLHLNDCHVDPTPPGLPNGPICPYIYS